MTKAVFSGKLQIGGGAPVSIQSMTNTDTRDVEATARQIDELAALGADLVRVSIPDKAAALAFKEIKAKINIPLAVDIHFDYRLALLAEGADKVRINPGNIGGEKNIEILAKAMKERGVPIRVGANSGSIKKEFKHLPPADALVESALAEAALLEKYGFFDIVISVKSSSVRTVYEANLKLSKLCSYPIHLGVTEAGVEHASLIKSSAGIGALLLSGIGDTIRVSIAGEPNREIIAAKTLLKALNLRNDAVEIVACPTCARTSIDVERIASELTEKTAGFNLPLKIAVMGCVVNGVGEAEDADLGVFGAGENPVIYLKGERYKTTSNADAASDILALVEEHFIN
ncbi:MAG: flavodoxin-dependent (E)-4-hydroxy-3-methylbut-2-enyl-diphosphate synthase [Christensenellales bacterium]|jgi:(E)-4-hydroxy-3-methylbut-2-enyl-diphosphate synthase